MAKKTEKAKVTIDNKEYSVDSLSENAKAQLANIQFVDAQLQQLNNEWAVADTARIAHECIKKGTSGIKTTIKVCALDARLKGDWLYCDVMYLPLNCYHHFRN